MKTEQLYRAIYILSSSLIVFWIIVIILKRFIPLEITNPTMVEIYYKIRFFGLPIAILLTLFGTIKKEDKSYVILSKVTGTIIFCGFSVFLLFMGIFAGMCQWYNPKVHFIKKNDNATKIVERSYGCGASDSGPPIQKYFKVKELTSFLNWTTEVDLKEIDRKEWNEAVIQ